MAKITIVIEDTEDNNVNITMDFDPPFNATEDGEETHAQYAAAVALAAITKAGAAADEE